MRCVAIGLRHIQTSLQIGGCTLPVDAVDQRPAFRIKQQSASAFGRYALGEDFWSFTGQSLFAGFSRRLRCAACEADSSKNDGG
ncbi:hypothetical protein XAC3615_14140005 [Xanthomonas citri pv. citri]|nr:hypothetical protein XAC3615_14140005 [Xanthomonas citri pv. citri]